MERMDEARERRGEFNQEVLIIDTESHSRRVIGSLAGNPICSWKTSPVSGVSEI